MRHQETNNLTRKWIMKLNYRECSEDAQIAKKYLKSSPSLETKDMQIKTTQRSPPTPDKVTNLKTTKHNYCCWGCKELGPTSKVDESAICVIIMETSAAVP